jgi:tRNA (guanine10-N2)-dimethyltransferase
MDPRLARAMLNISGLPPGSRILDPFMGPGGLAVEASHLGLRYTGIEIDPEILSGARRNLEYLGGDIPARGVLGDSRRMDELDLGPERYFDGIVTDPPFGRSASLRGSEGGRLVREVLGKAHRLLREGSPVVLDAADPTFLNDLEGFRLELTLPHRVHRSLTRHIIVLTKA